MEFSISIRRNRANKENTPVNTGALTVPQFISVEQMADIVGLSSRNKYNIDTKQKTGQQEAYDYCPIVSAIIGKRSQYSLNGILMVDDKPVEELPDNSAIKKILIAPNPLQTISEFQNQVNIYRDLFGYCPIYKVYGANRNTGVPMSLYAVNPLWCDIVLSNKIVNQQSTSGIIESISFKLLPNGELITLKGEAVNNIYFLKGRNSDKNNPAIMQSPLYDCSDAINNYNIAINVYGNLMQNSVMGIIANRGNSDINTMTGKLEKDTVQRNIEEKHGLVSGRNHFIITSANMSFQSLMANVGNLGLPEAIKISVNTLCNKLGFSPELLADEQAKFENKKIAEIGHYQSETMPAADEMARMFTEILGVAVAFSYNHVAVLQEAEERRVDALNKSIEAYGKLFRDNLITQNEYLMNIGQQPRDGGDKYISEISNVPLAVKFGVGGTTAIQAILIDTTLTPEQKKGILQVLFSISEQDASLMLNL